MSQPAPTPQPPVDANGNQPSYFDYGRMSWVFQPPDGEAPAPDGEQPRSEGAAAPTPPKAETPVAGTPPKSPSLDASSPPRREKQVIQIIDPASGQEVKVPKVEGEATPKVHSAASTPILVPVGWAPGAMPMMHLHHSFDEFPEEAMHPQGEMAHYDPNRGSRKGSKRSSRNSRTNRNSTNSQYGQGQLPYAYNKNRKRQPRGDLYIPGQYSASMGGKFWCLSMWPTGERDDNHRCQFGRHKLDVESTGVVRPHLVGGVGEYRVTLHLCPDGDMMNDSDPDGWIVATCGPDMVDMALTSDAEALGWVMVDHSGHPALYPPGYEHDDSDEEEAPEEEAKEGAGQEKKDKKKKKKNKKPKKEKNETPKPNATAPPGAEAEAKAEAAKSEAKANAKKTEAAKTEAEKK